MQVWTRVWGGLGLVMLGLSSRPALAFNQAPLSLKETRGVIQLSNPSARTLDLNLGVFAVIQKDGRPSAELTPMPVEQAEQLIRLRPTQVLLSSGATRTIPYTILDSKSDFFVCGVSSQGLVTLRVCSRWRSALPLFSSSSRLGRR
jgi:hypothetical protein